MLASKCRRQSSVPSQASSTVSDPTPLALRAQLTNGELPSFQFRAPTTPKTQPVDGDRLGNLMTQAEVLIVTAAQIELDTALSVLEPSEDGSVLFGYKGQAVYYFGRLGQCNVVVAKCKAGSSRRDAAAMTVLQAIADCDPSAVIAVGIGFGGYTSKLKIGDVLVSEQIIPYELKRVGVTNEQYRGPIPEAGPVLLNRFTSALGWNFERPDGYNCIVRPGPLLSGESLLDNLDEKVRLFQEHPTAIGGEMEAVGIYAAASRHGTTKEWIIVKAVCDWADGTKKAKGDDYQPLAAAASLSLVKFVLSLPNALSDLSAGNMNY